MHQKVHLGPKNQKSVENRQTLVLEILKRVIDFLFLDLQGDDLSNIPAASGLMTPPSLIAEDPTRQ